MVLYIDEVRKSKKKRPGDILSTFVKYTMKYSIGVGDIFLAVTIINQINVSLSFFPLLFS